MSTATLITVIFAWTGGVFFLFLGAFLSYRQKRLNPVLLLSVCALSFSWMEAPYDWACYANFDPSWPRMPSWWPFNYTWGGLPASVPLGYIPYFVLPAVIGATIGRWLAAKFHWRRPWTLLTVGLVVGCVWAFLFNAILGARGGSTQYGYVIGGLALWEGEKWQYPLYDTLAMGVQMMLFTYLMGRTDSKGRTVLESWAAKRTSTRSKTIALAIAAVIVVGHLTYAAVFLPHLITKLAGYQNVGPTEEIFPGYPNQPLHGGLGGSQRYPGYDGPGEPPA
ncbi:spirocyclase AveC family protein [Mycolicibacterium pyrenivorans]|uniref:spirocyclase AveC family protein n=1 Tax=Mycolicibacterium pyrenivorans TaxID=187102 RepID=UPI0021F2B7F9|nr:spirocyclase AveC family protein [Mycolicibacterium pyrenivorans]MCV7151377.1 spirocyclase AveC family protein [Mycolicibacterium pyrenivorans]